MKAIDIATRNHITIEDLIEVCKELKIACDTEEIDLPDKDIFLIEKKIEVIKKKKNRSLEKTQKGKKIKLKRRPAKVQKEKVEEAKPQKVSKTADSGKKTVKAAAPVSKTTAKKPEDAGRHAGDSLKPYGKGPRTDSKTRKKEEVIGGATPAGKESAQKRKKGKEKNRKRYKKEIIEKDIIHKKKTQEPRKREAVIPDKIQIIENIAVGDLAKKLNIKANELISKLMKLGVMATINQVIDADTVEILASEYGTTVEVVSLYDETVIKQVEDDRTEDYIHRPPIVTVMGHVDHGKTMLLDAIRETNVTADEHGGITQHIGAYSVSINEKMITFLDTPGHEAFTTMRARGAKITDIVILVVAANDGVMPQTIEAINHAKDADVPIIVAINKIDLDDANVDRVKKELSGYGLSPEEWGGTTLFAEISAKFKQNIDSLLELILIQAEMLELTANPKLMAKGTVIEARLDPGRGSVSTILIQNGTLHLGDPFLVGIYSGKVRALFDDRGRPIETAGPAMPVEVLGISGVPAAGDPFEGVETEKFAKQISHKRLEYRRIESAKRHKKVTLESLNDMIQEGKMQELRVVVKADVDGSAQALKEMLEKIVTVDARVKVIHTGTGGINESDVMLASASNAIIIGYHVRPTGRISEIAEKENVSIQFYNVIFEATAHITAALEGMLSPDIKEDITGSGEVKQIFKISKLGTIAGSFLDSGKVNRTSHMRLLRDGVVVFDGKLKSLKRFKDDVSEVQSGQEFGFALDSYNDIKVGDTFEAYTLTEISRKI